MNGYEILQRIDAIQDDLDAVYECLEHIDNAKDELENVLKEKNEEIEELREIVSEQLISGDFRDGYINEAPCAKPIQSMYIPLYNKEIHGKRVEFNPNTGDGFLISFDGDKVVSRTQISQRFNPN